LCSDDCKYSHRLVSLLDLEITVLDAHDMLHYK
jgi:hypothetical protein